MKAEWVWRPRRKEWQLITDGTRIARPLIKGARKAIKTRQRIEYVISCRELPYDVKRIVYGAGEYICTNVVGRISPATTQDLTNEMAAIFGRVRLTEEP